MSEVQLAANAFTTLKTMKRMLGIVEDETGNGQDDVLTLFIKAASDWVETMTGRKFRKQSYTEQYAASGFQKLILNQWPILSVQYVKDVTDGGDKVIDPCTYDFTMTGDIGVLYKDSGWPYRAYIGGLAYDPTMFRRTLEVRYTAGYIMPGKGTKKDPPTLPFDLEKVVWDIVRQEYMLMENGADGLKAFSLSDASWTFDKEPRQVWLDTVRLYTRL